MTQQVAQILALLDAGARVHHGGSIHIGKGKYLRHTGYYCTVGGRKFPAVHLREAQRIRFLARETRRAQKKLEAEATSLQK